MNAKPNPGAITAKTPMSMTPAAPTVARERPKLSGAAIVGLSCIAGGLLLLCCLPVGGFGMIWVFSKSASAQPQPEPDPLVTAVKKNVGQEQAKGKGKAKEPPPMSPQVREAIDRGVVHLKKRVENAKFGASIDNKHPDEQATGVMALTGLALLEAKVPPDDPAVKQVLNHVRNNTKTLKFNYSQAACLFFLNRLDEAQPLSHSDRQLVRTLALRMIGGQKPDNRWFYTNNPITANQEQQLLDRLDANDYRPGSMAFGNGDNSQTQFAILALWGCRKHDLPVRPALLAAASRFNQMQNADGSWGYSGADQMFNDSNTCAGLIALAMDKTLREDKKFQSKRGVDIPADPKADDRVQKGFAHLAKAIGKTKDDPAPFDKFPQFTGGVIKARAYGDYYFLWCVERVGVIYDIHEIGGKDWYGWGSDLIVQNQRPDGSWQDKHGDVCDTCFAILFLTRANLAKDLTESIRTRGGKEAIP
jgi:hypothetical protein